ncbi:MAG: DUF424 family protein [Candidatus ainarchaeum sp.]|nr:DUF424 family protein [Candidatus ainarchaeum sp.]
MFAKIYEIDYKTILAVCDKEHIGKTFEEGNIFFEAKERFYKDKEITQKELEELLDSADSINMFGNKCVKVAQKKGLINETQVILINGIKHVQIYKI